MARKEIRRDDGDEEPRIAPRFLETLALIADSIELVLRRGDNGLDALDLTQHQIAGWSERRLEPSEAWRNIIQIHAALAETPRGAAPGTFMQVYERAVSG